MTEPTSQPLEIVIEPKATTFSSTSGAERIVRNAKDSFDNLGKVLSDAATNLKNVIDGTGADELQIGLSLSLEAEGKWLVVAGKAGATASVTLTWRK